MRHLLIPLSIIMLLIACALASRGVRCRFNAFIDLENSASITLNTTNVALPITKILSTGYCQDGGTVMAEFKDDTGAHFSLCLDARLGCKEPYRDLYFGVHPSRPGSVQITSGAKDGIELLNSIIRADQTPSTYGGRTVDRYNPTYWDVICHRIDSAVRN